MNKFRLAVSFALVLGAFFFGAITPAGALDSHSENDFDNSSGGRAETTTTIIRSENSAGVTLGIAIVTLGSLVETDASDLDHPMLWAHYCTGSGVPFVDGATVTFDFEVDSPTTVGNGIYRVACVQPAGATYVSGRYDLPTGALPPIDAATLRAFLATEIEVEGPTVASSPPFDTRPAVVNIETWLWVTDPWVEETQAVSVNGYDIELTATPLQVEWDIDEPGFGGPLICDGPGTAWASGSETTSCSHTFTQSSAGHGQNDAFAATATVTWEYSWSWNGVDQGTFATVDGVTTFDVQVGEIQAVVSG